MLRFRPRISLLTAFLLLTIVGMAIVIVQLWREVGPLRAENKRFNEERGTLVIGDPNKLHAIAIPERFAGEDRRSFRVYVPPGQVYFAFAQVNNIPKEGIPDHQMLPGHAGFLGIFQGLMFARLKPGEHTVTVRTLRSGRTADIQLVVAFSDLSATLDACANTSKDQWPTAIPETYTVYSRDGVRSVMVAADGPEPLVLLRYRTEAASRESMHVSYSIPEPNEPLDGMMLWLERAAK